MDTVTDVAASVTEDKLRRWLSLMGRPDELADPEMTSLLESQDRLPDPPTVVSVGRAAVELLSGAIERLRPSDGAGRAEQMPYLALKMCYVDGAKSWQAANELGVSERQLTRERARGLRMVKAELEAGPAKPRARETGRQRTAPVPAILGFMPRPATSRAIRMALDEHHLVHVHGAPGVGKSALVADLVNDVAEGASVLWYRFRQGVNDSLVALLFDIGEDLRDEDDGLAAYMASALPSPDPSLASRLALKCLGAGSQLIVLDDYHLVEDEREVGGLLEDAVTRLGELKIILISRYRDAGREIGASYEVTPLTPEETQSFLSLLGIEVDEEMAEKIHTWTSGICNLVKLAASWLKTATPEEVAHGTQSLGDLEEVQSFLLTSITDLIGLDDRAILHAASVFRDRFTDDALAFVAQRTRGEVQDATVRFVRAYIASRGRAGDVAFFNVSVRNYAYDRLPLTERAALHARAALWYERQGDLAEAMWHRKQALPDASL